MKIAVLCHKDQAGSGMMFVRALRSQGHTTTLYTKMIHEYGYEYDVLFNGPKSSRTAIVREDLSSCDILHFKGDQLPFTGPYKMLRGLDVPSVITVGGSGFRRRTNTLPAEACQHWYPVQRYRNVVGAMGAITPELLYNPSMVFTPHAYPEVSQVKISGTPILGHSPSHRGKKGTDTLFMPAVDILRSRGVKFDLRVIEKTDNTSCVSEKSKCSLFFDQGLIPAYGMSAVEAMMMGIPVVTRMTEEVKQKDPIFTGSPLFTTEGMSAQELADKLEEALGSDLRVAGQQTRAWAMELHSYEAVSKRLMGLYSKSLTSPCIPPLSSRS